MSRTIPATPRCPPPCRDRPCHCSAPWLPAAIPAWPPWARARLPASRPPHGRPPAAHRQEVTAEVEGWLFMLFFLYKSGRGWTIPDRTSCVCCALITGAARRTNTAAACPEGRGAVGRHPHPVPARPQDGGDTAGCHQGHVEGQAAKEEALPARLGSHLHRTTALKWLPPPPSHLAPLGARLSHSLPASPLKGGWWGPPLRWGCPHNP